MSTDHAAQELLRAHETFIRVLASTVAPGVLQKAAHDLAAATDHYADCKRESVRGVAA